MRGKRSWDRRAEASLQPGGSGSAILLRCLCAGRRAQGWGRDKSGGNSLFPQREKMCGARSDVLQSRLAEETDPASSRPGESSHPFPDCIFGRRRETFGNCTQETQREMRRKRNPGKATSATSKFNGCFTRLPRGKDF